MNTFPTRLFKAALILVAVATLAVVVASFLNKTPTDYEIELAKIENDILSAKTSAPSGSAERALTLVYLLYLKATLTGSLDDFKVAETETNMHFDTSAHPMNFTLSGPMLISRCIGWKTLSTILTCFRLSPAALGLGS